jgi:hypothetical protein
MSIPRVTYQDELFKVPVMKQTNVTAVKGTSERVQAASGIVFPKYEKSKKPFKSPVNIRLERGLSSSSLQTFKVND